jgi:hypothetical protein
MSDLRPLACLYCGRIFERRGDHYEHYEGGWTFGKFGIPIKAGYYCWEPSDNDKCCAVLASLGIPAPGQTELSVETKVALAEQQLERLAAAHEPKKAKNARSTPRPWSPNGRYR